MKTGRNTPCPCGSGKKYKKCCMRKDENVHREEQEVLRYEQDVQNGLIEPFASEEDWEEEAIEDDWEDDVDVCERDDPHWDGDDDTEDEPQSASDSEASVPPLQEEENEVKKEEKEDRLTVEENQLVDNWAG